MNTTYKKNFLTSVIVRADFPSPLKTEELPNNFRKTILKEFPISESKKLIQQQFKIGSDEKLEVKANLSGTEWNFYGHVREKQLVINPNFISVTYSDKYNSFNEFQSEFLLVLESLFNEYENVDVTRLGLRYINEIYLPGPNPLSWEGYLNPDLLSIFEIPENKETILRGFSELIFSIEGMNLIFKYGMHNPDYPAPIKKKIFILDFDAQYHYLQDLKDIQSNLVKAHNEIKKMFEKNIKNDLRMILDEQNVE